MILYFFLKGRKILEEKNTLQKILFCFLIVIFFLFPCLFIYSVDYEQGQDRIAEGIELFSKGLYEQALVLFRSMIVDPELRYHHGDAYFWISGANGDVTSGTDLYEISVNKNVTITEVPLDFFNDSDEEEEQT